MEALLTSTGVVALAEIGDKTQIATVVLAAHYAMPVTVVIGTTLGMLIADVPAVFVGDKLATRVPLKVVHSVAATEVPCEVMLDAAAVPGARNCSGCALAGFPRR